MGTFMRVPFLPLAAALLAAAAFLLVHGESHAQLLADAKRGAEVYERCAGCHSLDRNRVGPAHRGVFGRRAGSAASFRYSKALAESGVVWDEITLDLWLANPSRYIPGSRMGYRLSDPQDRADVIAFLRQAGQAAAD